MPQSQPRSSSADPRPGRITDRTRPGRVSDAWVSIVIRESSTWEPLDELAREAPVTVRSDGPVEAQLEDLRGLLDRRIGLLTTRESHPRRARETPKPLAVA